MRVITTPGKKETGHFALQLGAKVIDYFSDYYGIAYPITKAVRRPPLQLLLFFFIALGHGGYSGLWRWRYGELGSHHVQGERASPRRGYGLCRFDTPIYLIRQSPLICSIAAKSRVADVVAQCVSPRSLLSPLASPRSVISLSLFLVLRSTHWFLVASSPISGLVTSSPWHAPSSLAAPTISFLSRSGGRNSGSTRALRRTCHRRPSTSSSPSGTCGRSSSRTTLPALSVSTRSATPTRLRFPTITAPFLFFRCPSVRGP